MRKRWLHVLGPLILLSLALTLLAPEAPDGGHVNAVGLEANGTLIATRSFERAERVTWNVRLAAGARSWTFAFSLLAKRHRHLDQRRQTRARRGTLTHPWDLHRAFRFYLPAET